jgi:hypothetical protein
MANIIADRVLETSTTTGLGSYTLVGPVLGFRTVASVASIGDTFTYCAEDINPTTGQNLGGWEVGLGTVVGANSVQRTQIYSSSNANAAVNWTSGTRRIALSVTTNTIAVGSQSAGLMSAADKTKLDSITGTNTGDNATNSQYSGLVTNATHTGDATGTGALTVVGINGTLLSGLSTGILKNTTGTGVPSIAAAGTDFQAPLVSGTNIKTRNGSTVLGAGDLVISAAGVNAVKTPMNVTPSVAATGVMDNAMLTGSTFMSLYGTTMTASQWQVSIVSDFLTTVIDTGDVVGTATSYAMAGGGLVLNVNTTYFWRARYKDNEGSYSDWSTATAFTTASTFVEYISTPTATPAAFGDALEGGFYTGMIWNELVQSTFSTLISTGSKVFTVPSMSATPLVYAGQELEVRSRANPANKMNGTVTGALGTSLTINITSVGGSGTFADWSIMAKFRIIVSPKASGEISGKQYKNTNTASPAACGTLSEGRKATLAMVAADTSTVYPAAHWCNNLSIAGKSDWYLPARDELELCFRNLKTGSEAAYAASDRPTGSTPNYMNLGSYGDVSTSQGVNNNSSPTGAAYTSGSPTQVAAGKNFRTGESEAFAYGTAEYWSATESSTTGAWLQDWISGYPGYQFPTGKNAALYIRAVRRSII